MKKQYIVEFGIRGGQHRRIYPLCRTQAIMFAANMVALFLNKDDHPVPPEWDLIGKHMDGNMGPCPRLAWQSQTHFVALSVLDGVPRGDAASTLWRRDDGRLVKYIKPIPIDCNDSEIVSRTVEHNPSAIASGHADGESNVYG